MLKIAERLESLGFIVRFSIRGEEGTDYKAQMGVIPGDTFRRVAFNDLTERMKENLSVPVLAAGCNIDTALAEEALIKGKCDLVEIIRAIIADPDLPKKSQQSELTLIRS